MNKNTTENARSLCNAFVITLEIGLIDSFVMLRQHTIDTMIQDNRKPSWDDFMAEAFRIQCTECNIHSNLVTLWNPSL
jgi:hypothetical protein